MRNIERILDIKLPERQSAFLWGPRKTGKTTYLKRHFPVILDEVQKVPQVREN